jgi:hypothetical protein
MVFLLSSKIVNCISHINFALMDIDKIVIA